jgi:hypothetical protein
MKREMVKMTCGCLVLCLLVLAGAQPALADKSPGRTLVGSWEVFITNEQGLPPNLDMTTVNRDGTLTNSDSLFGTGHGAWKRAGDGQFQMTFRTPVLATAGGPPLFVPIGSVLTVTATVTVDESGMAAIGPYTAEIVQLGGSTFCGFNGHCTLTGLVAFSRITVD